MTFGQKGNSLAIRAALAPLVKNGQPDYPALMTIPTPERIPALAAQDRKTIHTAIYVQLEYTFKLFNLAAPMTVDQGVLLADLIIDEAAEDNLALQDVYIFLGRLVAGKYGPLYNRMDIPSFMEKFEQYRQDRHKAYLDARYETQVNQKAMGDRTRETADEKGAHREALADHLKTLYKDEPGKK